MNRTIQNSAEQIVMVQILASNVLVIQVQCRNSFFKWEKASHMQNESEEFCDCGASIALAPSSPLLQR